MIYRRGLFASLLTASAFLLNGVQLHPLNMDCENETGNWGEWTEWTPCTRSCGSGVSTRTRNCLTASCTGERIEYRSCCVEQCLSKTADTDFRAAQCKVRASETSLSDEILIPAQEGNDGCMLICINDTTRNALTAYVQDGTSCSRAETGERGVCLGNLCAEIGCDGIVGSEKKEDKCLRCLAPDEADNHCQQIHLNAVYPTDPIVNGNIVVMNLPKEATSIRITHPLKLAQGMLALSIHGQDPQTLNESTEVGGAKFQYHVTSMGNHKVETLSAKGPLSEPITVELVGVSGTEAPTVEYEYYLLASQTNGIEPGVHGNEEHSVTEQEIVDDEGATYEWEYGCFGPCSVTCGAGVQVSIAKCHDSDYPDREIDDALCLNHGMVKPSPVQRICKLQSCPARWVAGKWNGCPTECSKYETQEHRHVGCYKFKQDGSAEDLLPEFECTSLSKPIHERQCAANPCYAEWTAGQWSQCTGACNGTQERTVVCTKVATGDEISSSNCTQASKPTATRSCGTKCKCYWKPAPWLKCDNKCGPGTQTRRAVRCRRISDNHRANDSCCDGLEKPQTQRECYSTRSKKCKVFWNKKPYGKCGCCSNLRKEREVVCSAIFNELLVTFPDEFCQNITKPPTSEKCTISDCPKWVISAYGPCSATCGDSIQTRQIHCEDNGERVADEMCECTDRKPPTDRVCLVPTTCPTTTEPPCVDISSPAQCNEVPSVCETVHKEFCCATCRQRTLSNS